MENGGLNLPCFAGWSFLPFGGMDLLSVWRDLLRRTRLRGRRANALPYILLHCCPDDPQQKKTFHRTQKAGTLFTWRSRFFLFRRQSRLFLIGQSFLVVSSRCSIMAGFTRTVTELIPSPPS